MKIKFNNGITQIKFKLLILFMFLIYSTECSNSISFLNSKNNLNTSDDNVVIWKQIFIIDKPSTPCVIKNLKKSTTNKKKAIIANNSNIVEVKKWGFEDSAYLFDYLDIILRNPILNEFKLIYNDIMRIPNNEPNIPANNLLSNPRAKKIFVLSVNEHQLTEAQKFLKWNIQDNDIKKFISHYDINHDTRLSPKELILASIDTNYVMASSTIKCTHCFEDVSKQINAIFSYIDCGQGYVGAEQIWKSLSKLKRNSDAENIYKLAETNKKAKNSVNDFILKNTKSKIGQINKNEFLSGILLGYWDRHTDDEKIIDDDSKSLKNLRWKK